MIEFVNVSKEFKDHKVLSNINMTINDKELVAIIGASGCGKTTTLKMINRLIKPTSGEILIDGKNIDSFNKTELRRSIGYVIQQMGLFPHMTIKENIELIQKLEKKDKAEIEANTKKLMKLMDLNDEYLSKYPTNLSGGQQQRVGVARALANNPKIILMDEPFSALDPITRVNLQDELVELHKKMDTTIVFVTHDMDEAIKIADRICIMKDGNIVQFDTPEEILKNPKNEFVENFIGKNKIWDSPEYIKVKDIMISNPITCRPNLDRSGCIQEMVKHHIDTLVVTDEDGYYLGIVNRKGLYSAKRIWTKAIDMIKNEVITADPDESILELLQAIEEYDMTNIPVVNMEGKLCGLITSSSLISVLSSQYIEDTDEIDEADEEALNEEVKVNE